MVQTEVEGFEEVTAQEIARRYRKIIYDADEKAETNRQSGHYQLHIPERYARSAATNPDQGPVLVGFAGKQRKRDGDLGVEETHGRPGIDHRPRIDPGAGMTDTDKYLRALVVALLYSKVQSQCGTSASREDRIGGNAITNGWSKPLALARLRAVRRRIPCPTTRFSATAIQRPAYSAASFGRCCCSQFQSPIGSGGSRVPRRDEERTRLLALRLA